MRRAAKSYFMVCACASWTMRRFFWFSQSLDPYTLAFLATLEIVRGREYPLQYLWVWRSLTMFAKSNWGTCPTVFWVIFLGMPQAAFYWQIGVTKLQKQRDWAKSSASQPYGTVRAIPAIVYMHPYDLALLERIWREVYNHQFEMGSWMLEEDLGPKNRLQMQDPRDSKRSLQTHCVFFSLGSHATNLSFSLGPRPSPPQLQDNHSAKPK
jgi:hypothetical protein